MLEQEKDIIYRVYKALLGDEKLARRQLEGIPDTFIPEVSERIEQLFREWADENDYVKRDDCVEIANEMGSDRRSMMMEAYD